ncbi:phosphotransferase family protein [Kitasatospora sp. NBC_01302]|uniref:phosphotransferase family protein n=1 Tax=Kitasatospora sp. NBC_01302 TaxID=2903575 RepID=UPI002E0D37EE|nr:phosphotransferase family protein [Kitasatospora sp. NBC_01302]
MTDNPPGLDLAALRAHLGTGALSAELIEGGRSNLTYRLTDGERRWVLRRPPLGHVLATAHDMAREYRVIGALADSPVPVPRAVRLTEDPSVIGAPFYLMEFVEGTAHRDSAALAALGPARVRALADHLVDTLVALHGVDLQEVGLADFGRPEGFLARQVQRWGKQLAASRSREVAGIDELATKLDATLPPSPAPTLLHGDYRLDNVLVGPDDRITAVLDWEMSTLGDPLTDLGLLVMYTELAAEFAGVIPGVALAPGFPSGAELIDRYAGRSGRDVAAVDWYVAFASFKLAVVLEGIHFRYGQGRTVGAGFDRVGELVPLFVAHGLTALKER